MFSSLSANILFLVSSQFCSCLLTTSTVPIVSFISIENTFLSRMPVVLFCSPHSLLTCYLLFPLGGRRATTAWGRATSYFSAQTSTVRLQLYFTVTYLYILVSLVKHPHGFIGNNINVDSFNSLPLLRDQWDQCHSWIKKHGISANRVKSETWADDTVGHTERFRS